MASNKNQRDPDYYPLRWKFADFVENILILHRTRAAIAIALLGVGLVVAGLFILGWRPGGSEESAAANAANADTEITDDNAAEDIADDLTNADGDAEAIEGQDVEASPAEAAEDGAGRQAATPEQLLVTPSGTVAEIADDTIRLVGGLPSEAAADRSLDLITEFFGTFEVVDDQVVNEEFDEPDAIFVSIVEPTLFAEQTAEINPRFFGVFDAISDYSFANGELSIEVRAHVVGQQLSDDRAEAVTDQLVASLVEPETISAAGFDGGGLVDGQTSRIDFLIG